MIESIQITYKCTCCDSKIETDEDGYDLNAYCNECKDSIIYEERIKGAIESASNNDYDWKNREIYCGFNSEPEKTSFMNGVRYGYKNSLFWIADYFDLIEFYEESIQNKFEKEEK